MKSEVAKRIEESTPKETQHKMMYYAWLVSGGLDGEVAATVCNKIFE